MPWLPNPVILEAGQCEPTVPQENLLVGVDGVDHQVHQTLGFRFELLLCHVAHLLYINIFENSVLALFAFEC